MTWRAWCASSVARAGSPVTRKILPSVPVNKQALTAR